MAIAGSLTPVNFRRKSLDGGRVAPGPGNIKPWSHLDTVRMERVAGIEPARSAWEADRLPLHHTRLMLAGLAAALL